MPNFRHVISACYREILLREPDDFGLGQYQTAMSAGMTEAAAREEMLRSPEYAARFPSSGGGGGGGSSLTLPLRAAFYYPWFPEAWDQGPPLMPWTRFTPPSLYDSGDVETIMRHLHALEYGRFQAGIMSWWGPGHYTDGRVLTILDTTSGTASPLRWGFYYEAESIGNPSALEIRAHLEYLLSSYGSHPAALRINGALVVFVFEDAQDGNAMAARWAQARQGLNIHLVLKVYPGFQTCPNPPNHWHEYAPADAEIRWPGNSHIISPGFWLTSKPNADLGRDIGRFKQNIRSMVAANEPWQLVSTFNEWGEGTIVEEAGEWPSASGFGAYLDALHNNGA